MFAGDDAILMKLLVEITIDTHAEEYCNALVVLNCCMFQGTSLNILINV